MPSKVLSLALAFCFAPAAAVHDGVRRSAKADGVVDITATGFVRATDDLDGAVRRQMRKPAMTEIGYQAESEFAGKVDVVEFKEHANISCSSSNGGAELDNQASMRLTLSECKSRCTKDDRCTCVSFNPTTGTCAMQKYCIPSACTPSALISSYEMVANYTVGGVTYRRAGGWECSSSGESQAIDIDAQPAMNVTPSQCLQRCNDDPACTCVRYERYYKNLCWKRKNCPSLGKDLEKCERSDKLDTYIRTPTNAATNSPTQVNCFGQANFVNFDWATNNTCSNQPCSHYNTADPYYAYCKKMACANTQRDAWCAAGGSGACRNECGRCSAAEQADCL